jgi:integrase/recombinase XerD
MLTIYRRHMAACKFQGRKYRNCNCPIWAAGTLHGRKVKKSLDLRSWEAAQKLIRDWEASPQGAGLTLKDACDKYLAERKSKVSDSQLRKIKLVMRELEDRYGNLSLRMVTVDDLDSVLNDWKVARTTKQKRIEIMRQFFRFCEGRDWATKNPAKFVTAGRIDRKQVNPFSKQEMENIIWACRLVRDKHPNMDAGIEKKLRALVLLMRYSGLRITDAVTIKRDRIADGKLFLYQQKTKQPVWVPLPEMVVKALEEIDEGRDYYFWSGTSKLRHAATRWQDRLKKVFEIGGVKGGHPHRFRHTFAVEMLLDGVPLTDVSILLGHRSVRMTEIYAAWVAERQNRLEERVTGCHSRDQLLQSQATFV